MLKYAHKNYVFKEILAITFSSNISTFFYHFLNWNALDTNLFWDLFWYLFTISTTFNLCAVLSRNIITFNYRLWFGLVLVTVAAWRC